MAKPGTKIDKDTYKKEVAKLREALLEAQYELLEKKTFPVILIVSGVNGAGKSDMVNTLNYWMDPRNIHVHALGNSTSEELERPAMWKFWRRLPFKGTIGVFFGSWYSFPMYQHIEGHKDRTYLDGYLDDFLRFERMLADEGALILKFWLHQSKEDVTKRFLKLESKKKTKWRVTKHDWEQLESYDQMLPVVEHVVCRTSKPHAPWAIVESSDERTCNLTVGRTLLKAIRERLDDDASPLAQPDAVKRLKYSSQNNYLTALDLSQSLDKKDYKLKLEYYQKKLNRLMRSKHMRKRSVVLLFEGNDAAGKGGAIRRITGALDSRFYDIVPICAPTDEERDQPYLWRFWRKLPRKGHTLIFDRSWYGRVLVERVEKFLPEQTWLRAYGEINDFEETMALNGVIVMKFWLAVSSDEQLARFKDREKIGYKRFKLTDEDWRNREKWDDYAHAVCEMIDQTSTKKVPWTLVEANSKYFARVKILKSICERLEADIKPPVRTPEPMPTPIEN